MSAVNDVLDVSGKSEKIILGWKGAVRRHSCQLTFLNSEAHFRMVVEMGTGSVACVARTTMAF